MRRILWAASGVLSAVVCGLWAVGNYAWLGPAVILFFIALALVTQQIPPLKTFAFAFWVFAFVSGAMVYPAWFQQWGDFQLSRLIVPLIQIIMFGMGTTLSVQDFKRVLVMPKPICIGMGLQFSIMPFVGALIARGLGFKPEIAAGIILVGSCPGGVASNVITYLAKGDVPLSVTMTACSTLLSPLMTPLMMKWLAGQYIAIDFFKMMLTIIQIIIIPITAGLITNTALRRLQWAGAWMDTCLSVVAMFSICFIIAIITSLSRNELLQVGLALIAACVLHNMIGYILGYWGAWLWGLNRTVCRTIAIEVGLQNSGMATGLAINVLQNAAAALGPAIFGPWMNISGALLAAWWRRSSLPPGGEGS
ncbi:MAG TPA: bile acid:sodium symporter family protein [bacterium]|mgnify:CR=1 FL=1|nr:bile acid:sodium symporter family protein [bacterium]HOL93859.1 bile acid:sodium symporter family protein [bacterium]HPP00462.1 bile acid:sodium symporter family protein [bacterium]HXK92297.1 bile acid:sodium symporter family protein [bacterium]